MTDCCCDPPNPAIEWRWYYCFTAPYLSSSGSELIYAVVPPPTAKPSTWTSPGCPNTMPTSAPDLPIASSGMIYCGPCGYASDIIAIDPPTTFRYQILLCPVLVSGVHTAWQATVRLTYSSGCAMVFQTYLSSGTDILGTYTRTSGSSWAPASLDVLET